MLIQGPYWFSGNEHIGDPPAVEVNVRVEGYRNEFRPVFIVGYTNLERPMAEHEAIERLRVLTRQAMRKAQAAADANLLRRLAASRAALASPQAV